MLVVLCLVYCVKETLDVQLLAGSKETCCVEFCANLFQKKVILVNIGFSCVFFVTELQFLYFFIVFFYS